MKVESRSTQYNLYTIRIYVELIYFYYCFIYVYIRFESYSDVMKDTYICNNFDEATSCGEKCPDKQDNFQLKYNYVRTWNSSLPSLDTTIYAYPINHVEFP